MQERFIMIQHSKSFIILLILVLSLVIANVRINPAHATTATTTFQASANNWIDEQSPNGFNVQNWILEVAVFDTSGTQECERTLVRFDISSIPAGSQILSATLSLYYLDTISSSTSNPYGRTYWAYRLTQTAWDENLTNWNTYDGTNDWATPGGDYTTEDGASTTVPKYFDWMSWDVTNQVQTEYSSGIGTANFLIKDGTESVGYNSSIGCDFVSRESVTSVNPSVSLAPTLTVEYSTYSVTINAHCNTEGIDVAVPITEDGSATGYTTPHTFSGLTGAHTFTVPGADSNVYPFQNWNTGENTTTIIVFSGGNYTVYYQAIPGDLNGDGKVGLDDLVILAQAYGSRPGDPNWNPVADIDGDGVVGLSDLVILAQHYGEQYSLESTQEQIRDDVMAFIEADHPETAQFMQSFNWTGGSTTPEGIVGAETYSYTSDGWNVTMQYPVVPNAVYSITANYTTPGPPAQATVAWQGTWQNGTITEKSYNFTP